MDAANGFIVSSQIRAEWLSRQPQEACGHEGGTTDTQNFLVANIAVLVGKYFFKKLGT